jgi:hypothetical protein
MRTKTTSKILSETSEETKEKVRNNANNLINKKMNIQDELQKIHNQYGTTEMANYQIEKLFDNEKRKFAVEFAEWCNGHTDDDWNFGKFKNLSVEQVLKIYEKKN